MNLVTFTWTNAMLTTTKFKHIFICEVKYCDFVVYTTQDLFAANSS